MEKGISVKCLPTGKIYSSLTEASNDTKDSITAIRNCCEGKTRHTKRYKWEFLCKKTG